MNAVTIPPLCGTSKAPSGWRCTRFAGHEGPCAAVHSSVEPPPVLGWRVEDDVMGPAYTAFKVQADQWTAEGRRVTALIAQL